MALATGHGALLHLDVALLALPVIGHAQAGLVTLGFQGVAVGAGLVFGALTFDKLPVLVDVVARGAIIDLCLFVVVVMVEGADRALQLPKGVDLQVGVLLGKSRNAAQRDAEHDRAENHVSV